MSLRFSFIILAATILLCLPVHAQDSSNRPTPEPTPARQRVNPNITSKEQAEFDEAKAADDGYSTDVSTYAFGHFTASRAIKDYNPHVLYPVASASGIMPVGMSAAAASAGAGAGAV
jgi:hypothetical protein